jgi:hypothetical protein
VSSLSGAPCLAAVDVRKLGHVDGDVVTRPPTDFHCRASQSAISSSGGRCSGFGRCGWHRSDDSRAAPGYPDGRYESEHIERGGQQQSMRTRRRGSWECRTGRRERGADEEDSDDVEPEREGVGCLTVERPDLWTALTHGSQPAGRHHLAEPHCKIHDAPTRLLQAARRRRRRARHSWHAISILASHYWPPSASPAFRIQLAAFQHRRSSLCPAHPKRNHPPCSLVAHLHHPHPGTTITHTRDLTAVMTRSAGFTNITV